MDLLIRSIEKTANIAAGYTVGTLVIENEQAYLQLDDNSIVPIQGTIEVKNGDHWQRLTLADILRTTSEGWPAYAGMDARVIVIKDPSL